MAKNISNHNAIHNNIYFNTNLWVITKLVALHTKATSTTNTVSTMATILNILTTIAITLISSTNSKSCTTSACVSVTNKCGVTLYLQRTTIYLPEGSPTSVTSINTCSSTVLDISDGSVNSGQRLYIMTDQL